jgi:hypothetical protein
MLIWICYKEREHEFIRKYASINLLWVTGKLKYNIYKFKIEIVYKQFFGNYFDSIPSQFINWATYNGAWWSIAWSLEHEIVI